MDISSFVVPVLLAGTALFALSRKVDVYSALTAGAGEGLSVMVKIFPALVALLSAVYMFRASGAMDFLTRLLAPALEKLGIPPETTAILLIRPLSGSGALAVATDLMRTHGPDSYIGRVAAVMLGSTETTFYTIAVYYGAAGIRRTRHTIPAALAADRFAALAAVSFFWVCAAGAASRLISSNLARLRTVFTLCAAAACNAVRSPATTRCASPPATPTRPSAAATSSSAVSSRPAGTARRETSSKVISFVSLSSSHCSSASSRCFSAFSAAEAGARSSTASRWVR